MCTTVCMYVYVVRAYNQVSAGICMHRAELYLPIHSSSFAKNLLPLFLAGFLACISIVRDFRRVCVVPILLADFCFCILMSASRKFPMQYIIRFNFTYSVGFSLCGTIYYWQFPILRASRWIKNLDMEQKQTDSVCKTGSNSNNSIAENLIRNTLFREFAILDWFIETYLLVTHTLTANTLYTEN